MQQAVRIFIAIMVSAPATVLIPFVGWVYGWQGVAVIIVLGLIPAYLFGKWIARQHTSISVWMWCFLSAVVSFLAAAWEIVTYAFDPGGWAWFLAGVATFITVLVTSCSQQK